jgi:RNA methyltransferase, TrmH family
MLSKTNIKYIQSLHHKKLREEEQCFIAEGPKVVGELLSSGVFECKMICALEGWLTGNSLLVAGLPGENIFVVDQIVLEKISLLKTPHQVLGVFRNKAFAQIELKNKLTLLLDDIHDPGNMGTIIRIADWFAVQNIVCSYECVECYNPKVVQSSMGSLVRVNILYADLVKFIADNKEIKLFAATLSGQPVSSFHKIEEGMIIIGNESKGVRQELLNLANEQITIPKFGKADSLNAGVAAGIILSHTK